MTKHQVKRCRNLAFSNGGININERLLTASIFEKSLRRVLLFLIFCEGFKTLLARSYCENNRDECLIKVLVLIKQCLNKWLRGKDLKNLCVFDHRIPKSIELKIKSFQD
jgi:hypothetical protein